MAEIKIEKKKKKLPTVTTVYADGQTDRWPDEWGVEHRVYRDKKCIMITWNEEEANQTAVMARKGIAYMTPSLANLPDAAINNILGKAQPKKKQVVMRANTKKPTLVQNEFDYEYQSPWGDYVPAEPVVEKKKASDINADVGKAIEEELKDG